MLSFVSYSLFHPMFVDKAGEVRIQPVESPGSICQIVSTMPQLFQRFPSTSAASLPDDRFNYFIKEVCLYLGFGVKTYENGLITQEQHYIIVGAVIYLDSLQFYVSKKEVLRALLGFSIGVVLTDENGR